MPRPTYTVEIGFTVPSLLMVIGYGVIGTAAIGGTGDDGVTWTQISGVQEIQCTRGRQDELGRFEAGTSLVVVDNNDGRFSPENTGSVYYPNVKPAKRIRTKMTHSGTDYWLFNHQIRRWRPMPGAGDARVVIEANDLFRRWARRKTSTAYSEQLTGARIAAIANALSVPSSQQDIDAGQSSVPAYTPVNEPYLQHLQDVTEVEDGQLWISGQGKVTFRDRHARLTDTVSVTSQATFGGVSGLPFREIGEYDYSDERVVTETRVTRTGGVEQVAEDVEAQREYDEVTYSLSSPHFINDTQAGQFGRWKLYQQKTPVPRLRGISLEGGGDDSLWAQIGARTINDRITVVRDFPGSFGLNRDLWIEYVSHRIDEGLNRHQTEYLLSAADTTNWFVIGHATKGKIGTGLIAGY